MASVTAPRTATLDDLYRIDGKAELIDGAIVHMPPTGDIPGHASAEVAFSLRAHAKRTGRGRAVVGRITPRVPFQSDPRGARSFVPV